ncbi:MULTISPECIES: hypothetical protein [unclassified Flavobacterium]|uniref:hypothetical protein n=1 Tax=unclassified Flavobacterium TaxID=196869 RepID=UPI00361DDEF9
MVSSVFKSKWKGILLLVLVFLVGIGCTDDASSDSGQEESVYYVCASCKSAPEALPEHDNSYKGIYSGVVNTDIVTFNIDNNNDESFRLTVLRGDLIRDFVFLNQWSNGNRFYAVFNGGFGYGHHDFQRFNVQFSVDLNGDNPEVIFTDEEMFRVESGRTIFKEKSTSLVEVFNGELSKRKNYLSTESRIGADDNVTVVKVGSQRIVLSRNEGYWYGFVTMYAGVNDEFSLFNSGSIVNNKLVDVNGKVVGTLIYDYFSGKSVDENQETINITAKRVI